MKPQRGFLSFGPGRIRTTHTRALAIGLAVVLVGTLPSGVAGTISIESTRIGSPVMHLAVAAGTHSPEVRNPHPAHTQPLAPSALTWWNITNESGAAAPVEWFTEGTWDTNDGYLVTYGGDNFGPTIWGNTVGFRGGDWSEIPTNGTSPGRIDGPALAYDASAHEVVMYGGYSSYSPFVYSSSTFLYSNGNWSSIKPTPSPQAPTAAAMTYDAALGGVVLFGGYNNSDSTGTKLLNDLWLFKNGSWSPLADLNPPAVRTWPSLAYDPVRQELILYGGITASYACLGDTYTYTGGWTKITATAGGPPGIYGTQMAYDPLLGGVVLTGGTDCGGANNTKAWLFNGSAWNLLSVGGLPSDHLYGIMAWDPADGVLLESGGNPAGGYTDVLSTPLNITDVSGPAAFLAGSTVGFNASIEGGVPSRNLSWEWGDSSPDSYGPAASHTYARAGNFTLTLHVTDAAGESANWTRTEIVGLVPRPAIQTPTNQLEVGVTGSFGAADPGGAAPITFTWEFGDGATASGPSVNHAFSSAGTFEVTVTARNATNAVSSVSTNISVAPRLGASVSLDSAFEVGLTGSVSAEVTGGVGPFSYQWTVDAAPVTGGVSANLTLSDPGSHDVAVEVSDSNGVTVTNDTTVNVAQSISASIVGPKSVQAGSSGQFTVSISGGVAPYSITWTSSDGQSGSGTTFSPALASVGTVEIRVLANDSLNASATATQDVTISGASSTSGFSTFDLEVAGAAGTAAVVIVAAALLLQRRRRR